MFQLFALYPHLNVRRNIAFPLVAQGMARKEIAQKVDEAARILQITRLLDHPVSALSAGDRQRVALGRAIVRQPLAFMMDEPLGALDSEFRELMCGELRALHDRLKATMVYVTHDQMEAMAMADTIAIMNGGVIEQLGAPQDVYDRPASVFVADFIGSPAMNFIPFAGAYAAGAAEVRIGAARVAVPRLAEAIAEAPLLCGVRPEHVRFDERSEPARRGRRQRIPRPQPDRDRDHRGRLDAARQGRPREDGAARRARRPGVRRQRGLAVRPGQRPRPGARSRDASVAELRLEGVVKRFGAVTAVDALSLEIASGEFIVLLGPSGAGKTTTLRLVAGLEAPDRGPGLHRRARTSPRPRRRCATSPSCSSSTRSIRT